MRLRPRLVRLAAVGVAAMAAATAPVAAQPNPATITVTGMRSLAFGSLIPGVPAAVVPTDPARAAQFDVRGGAAQQLQLVLALPLALQGPGGAQLPIRYGPSAAAYSLTSAPADAVAFDPAIPFTVSLPSSGRLQVFVGGTALPSGLAAPGRYTAVITLTASATGN